MNNIGKNQIIEISRHKTNKDIITIITAQIDNNVREFVGISKCHPSDKFNQDIGRALADSRAYAKYSVALAKWANGKVDQIDNAQRLKERNINSNTIYTNRLTKRLRVFLN